MATNKNRPLWDAKPSMSPAEVTKRFGKGTSLVKTGAGKWTVKGYNPSFTPARPQPPPEPPPPPGTGLVPREWAQQPGVIGPWRSEPRLDPTANEWMQNEAGQWFARPRTELTGLNPQQQADIRGADAAARAGQAGIGRAWDHAAQATSNYANAGAAHINALVNAPQAQTVDPTAQAMAANARAGAIPGVAAMQANLAMQPGVMQATGASAQQQFRAGYGAARAGQIQGYRNAQQEAAAAAREQNLKVFLETLGINAQAAATQLNAQTDLAQTGITVEGQNLRTALEQQEQNRRTAAQEEGRMARAEIAALTAEQDRLARLTIEERKIAAQMERARANNASAEAIARLERRKTNLTNRRKEQKAKTERIGKLANMALGWWNETIEVPTNSFGGTEVRGKYVYSDIVRLLMAQGASRPLAIRIATQITNQQPSTVAAPELANSVRW